MLRHCVEEQYLERDRQKEGTTTDEKKKNSNLYLIYSRSDWVP